MHAFSKTKIEPSLYPLDGIVIGRDRHRDMDREGRDRVRDQRQTDRYEEEGWEREDSIRLLNSWYI